MEMMGLAEPPHRWDAETTTAEALEALRPAVGSEVDSMVKADVTRLEPWIGFKNGCVVFPRQVGSCAERVRSQLLESEMADDLRREMMSVLLDAERLMKRWSAGLEKSDPFVGRYSAGQLRRIRSLLEARLAEVLDQLWYEFGYSDEQIDFETHKFIMMVRLMCAGARPGDDAFVPEPGARVILAPERSESRIEKEMLAAFRSSCRLRTDPSMIAEHCRQSPAQRGIFIYQQAPVLGYRADFLLGAMAAPDAAPHWVVVECDGHQFHERTPEQAEHDRARDRSMTAAGYRVFRFTGREIMRDASRCSAEVLSYLRPFAGPKS
jgi:very-short-patch-repair endonuclease